VSGCRGLPCAPENGFDATLLPSSHHRWYAGMMKSVAWAGHRTHACGFPTAKFIGKTTFSSTMRHVSRPHRPRVCNADSRPRRADPVPDGSRWASRHDPAWTKNARNHSTIGSARASGSTPPAVTTACAAHASRISPAGLVSIEPAGSSLSSCTNTVPQSCQTAETNKTRPSQGARLISIPSGDSHWNGLRASRGSVSLNDHWHRLDEVSYVDGRIALGQDEQAQRLGSSPQ
jgi:hypothetical protein